MAMNGNRSDMYNPSDKINMLAFILTGGVAPLTLWFAPLLVGSYIEVLGFSERNAVLLLSGEMAGYALAGAVAFFLIPILNWRYIVLGAFLVLICSNIFAAWVNTYSILLVIRFCAGIGAGTLMSMSMIAIGLTSTPERIYGLWTAMQILTPAIILVFLPELIADYGLAAPFLIVAFIGSALIWVCRYYPFDAGRKSSGSALIGTSRAKILGAVGLIGIFVFFGGQSTVWSFVERIGANSGFSTESIGKALALGALAGLGGALSASLLGNVYGRVLPLVIAMLLSVTSVIILMQANVVAVFTIGLCLFAIAWNYSGPYLQAIISNLDKNGRLLALLAIVLPGSMSAGPAFVTSFLIQGEGYMPIFWMLLVALPIGFLLLYPAARLKT
jgi:predicted MFS family arabinose efflux permease